MKTNEKLLLIKPTEEDEAEVCEALNEFLSAGEDSIPGSTNLVKFDGYQKWLQYLKDFENESTVPVEGFVTSETYLLKREGESKVLGFFQFRHKLNEHLRRIGGHFGGSVRPSKRRRGYSTAMLELGLEKAKELGLKKVLITCKSENLGSAKSIIAAGGKLENEVMSEEGVMQRYWIEI